MRGALIKLSVVIAIATMVVWLACGANTKWSKNQRQVKTVDPVTEIEQVTWEKAFLPGLDFIGLGLGTAVALAASARFIRRTTNQ